VDGFFTGTGSPVDVNAPADASVPGLTRHALIEARIHPTFANLPDFLCPDPGADVAVMRLATPITDIAPLRLRASGPPALGATCRAIGYGLHTEDGGTTFGQKRAGKEIVAEVTTSSIGVRLGTAVAADGDSGGPLLCEGAIAAVTSCHADGDAGIATQIEFYGRIDVARPFIDQALADWR
jgi:hypothetical protein